MANLEINCHKINEFLSSFVTHTPVIKEKTCKSFEDKFDYLPSQQNSVKRKKLLDERLCNEHVPLKITANGKKKTLPNSENDFKERLSTFELGLWTSIDVSPLLCASYGWHLLEKDVLKCRTCDAVLCSSLPSLDQHEAYLKFLDILKQRLRSGHKEWCGWPSNPCPLEFVQPPISSTVHYLKNLKLNAVNLSRLNDHLPYIDRKENLRRLDLEESHVSLFYGSDQEPSSVQLTAAILVLFGWNFDSTQRMKCNLCLRSVGLWSYLSLAQEKEFHELKENCNLRQERRRQKEIKRKEKEERRKVKEEKKLALLERQKKDREAEEKAMAESKKVQEAMDKISRLEESGLFSDMEENREDEDLTEDEERSLLQEEEKDESLSEKSGCDDTNEVVEEACQQALESSKESTDQNVALADGSGNMEEGNSSDESFDSEKQDEVNDAVIESGGSSPADNLSYASNEEHEQIESNSESEGDKISGDEAHSEGGCDEENELWLEAVGGFERNDQLPMSGDESAAESEKIVTGNDSYDSSSCSEEGNRKRSRSTDESDSEVDEASEKKAKFDSQTYEEENKITNSPEAAVDDVVRAGDIENVKENVIVDDGMDSVNFSDVTPLEGNKSDEKGSESDAESCSESDVSEDEEPAEEDQRFHKLESSLFDPIGEHRHWCGWVTESLHHERGEQDTVFGYNILPPQLREILPEFSSPNLASSAKYARNIEGLRAVRSILDSWAVLEEAEEMEL